MLLLFLSIHHTCFFCTGRFLLVSCDHFTDWNSPEKRIFSTRIWWQVIRVRNVEGMRWRNSQHIAMVHFGVNKFLGTSRILSSIFCPCFCCLVDLSFRLINKCARILELNDWRTQGPRDTHCYTYLNRQPQVICSKVRKVRANKIPLKLSTS